MSESITPDSLIFHISREDDTPFLPDGGPFGIKVPDMPLEYFPNSGEFVWTEDVGKKKKGSIAGSINRSLGYWQIRYNKKLYYSHRLAYLAMEGKYPDGVVDHIDRDGLNNRWDNLRSVSHSENHLNTNKPINNTSGCKGIYYSTRDKRWIARVSGEFRAYGNTYAEAVYKLENWAKDKEVYNVCKG